MHTVSRDPNGIVLVCHDCPHVERVGAFDKKGGGSSRTQAARAMRIHSRDLHGAGSVLNAVPRNCGHTTTVE
jgi:hypothetical protein